MLKFFKLFIYNLPHSCLFSWWRPFLFVLLLLHHERSMSTLLHTLTEYWLSIGTLWYGTKIEELNGWIFKVGASVPARESLPKQGTSVNIIAMSLSLKQILLVFFLLGSATTFHPLSYTHFLFLTRCPICLLGLVLAPFNGWPCVKCIIHYPHEHLNDRCLVCILSSCNLFWVLLQDHSPFWVSAHILWPGSCCQEIKLLRLLLKLVLLSSTVLPTAGMVVTHTDVLFYSLPPICSCHSFYHVFLGYRSIIFPSCSRGWLLLPLYECSLYDWLLEPFLLPFFLSQLF